MNNDKCPKCQKPMPPTPRNQSNQSLHCEVCSRVCLPDDMNRKFSVPKGIEKKEIPSEYFER